MLAVEGDNLEHALRRASRASLADMVQQELVAVVDEQEQMVVLQLVERPELEESYAGFGESKERKRFHDYVNSLPSSRYDLFHWSGARSGPFDSIHLARLCAAEILANDENEAYLDIRDRCGPHGIEGTVTYGRVVERHTREGITHPTAVDVHYPLGITSLPADP